MPEPIRTLLVQDSEIPTSLREALEQHPDLRLVESSGARPELLVLGEGDPGTPEWRNLVRAGVPLVLASPGAWGVSALRALATDAADGGGAVIPALLSRFHLTMIRVRSAIAQGAIGLPWSAVGERSSPPAGRHSLAGDAVEALDVIRNLTGLDPVRVTARGVDRHLVLSAEFERGLVASMTAARYPGQPVVGSHHLHRIMGNEGIVIADLSRPGLTIHADGHRSTAPFGTDPAAAFVDHVRDVVRGVAQPGVELADLEIAVTALGSFLPLPSTVSPNRN